MAPAATVGIDEETMSASFLLSNMSPQLAEFNRFGWADLESAVRECVYALDTLLVVTGPVFDKGSQERIDGDGPVVPNAFFKLLVRVDPPVAAFAIVVPHQAFSMQNLADYIVSPDELEEVTGLDFLASLGDEEESLLESESEDFCGMVF